MCIRDSLNAEALLNELLCVFGVLDAVTVTDEHGLTGWIDGRLLHTVYQRTDGGFAAAGLADVGQLAVVVGVHDGLDPVSYTHLDVYKRQILLFRIGSRSFA